MSLVVHKLVLSPGGATTNNQTPTHHVTLAAYAHSRSNVGETMGRSLEGSSSVSVSAPATSSFYSSSSSSKHSSSYNLPFVLQDHNYGAPPPPTPPQSPPPPPVPTASSGTPTLYHISSRQTPSHHHHHPSHSHAVINSSSSSTCSNALPHSNQQQHSHTGNHSHSQQHINLQYHHPHHQQQPHRQQLHQQQDQQLDHHHHHHQHQKSHHFPQQQNVSNAVVPPSQRLGGGVQTSSSSSPLGGGGSSSVSGLPVSQHPLSVMPPHRQQFMPHPKGSIFTSPHIPPLPVELHHSPSGTPHPLPPPPPMLSTTGPETDDDSRLSDRSSSVGPSGEETETAPEGEGDEQPVDDSITRCICDFSHDDGYMIQCDRCFVWQHVDCMEIDRDNIPDEYLCEACDPRQVDRFKARALQIRRRQEIKAHLARLSSSDSDDNLPMSSKSRGSSGKTTERKVVKKKKTKQIKDVKNNRKGAMYQIKKSGIPNTSGNNNPSEPEEKERKILVKTRRRKSSSMSGCEGLGDDSLGPVERLRAWVDDYEKAVTNHYSPELRARVHAARINGVSPDLRASTQGALLGHRCKVVTNPCSLTDIFDSKILVAATRLSANTAIAEYQGKYLLASQWIAQQPASGQVYLPYVLQYHMPKEGLSVYVDARTYGNDARFTRRSCKPNAEVRHVVERGSLHLYLVASRDIEEGEEVTLSLETANSSLELLCCYPEEHDCLHSQPIKTEQTPPPCHQTIPKKNGILSNSKKSVRKLNIQPQLRMSKRATSTESRTSEVVSVVPLSQSNIPVTPVKQRRTSGCGKSPIKSPCSSLSTSPEDSCKEGIQIISPVTPCSAVSPDTPKLIDKQQQQKMTREERKIAAYMKAFERMEKAAQRRQEMEKKKEEDKGKDIKDKDKKRSVVDGDEDEWDKTSSADESIRNTPNTERNRRKGKKGRGKGSPQKRSSRIDSTASDYTGDESSCASVGLMSPGGGTVEGIALNFNSPPQGGPSSIGFRFPKTKKSLMNEWLNETVDPVMHPVCNVNIGEVPSGVPTCYMRSPASSLRRSLSVTQGTIGGIQGTILNMDVPGGSAKKRWLRQAISEETESPQYNGLCPSPNSRPDSPTGGGDYITPLKKRRLARESMSSEQSSTPPTTPVHCAVMEDEKLMDEMEAEMAVEATKNKLDSSIPEDQSSLSVSAEKPVEVNVTKDYHNTSEIKEEHDDNVEKSDNEDKSGVCLESEKMQLLKFSRDRRGKKIVKKRGVNSSRVNMKNSDDEKPENLIAHVSPKTEKVEDSEEELKEEEALPGLCKLEFPSDSDPQLLEKHDDKGLNKSKLHVTKREDPVPSVVGMRRSGRQQSIKERRFGIKSNKGSEKTHETEVQDFPPIDVHVTDASFKTDMADNACESVDKTIKEENLLISTEEVKPYLPTTETDLKEELSDEVQKGDIGEFESKNSQKVISENYHLEMKIKVEEGEADSLGNSSGEASYAQMCFVGQAKEDPLLRVKEEDSNQQVLIEDCVLKKEESSECKDLSDSEVISEAGGEDHVKGIREEDETSIACSQNKAKIDYSEDQPNSNCPEERGKNEGLRKEVTPSSSELCADAIPSAVVLNDLGGDCHDIKGTEDEVQSMCDRSDICPQSDTLNAKDSVESIENEPASMEKSVVSPGEQQKHVIKSSPSQRKRTKCRKKRKCDNVVRKGCNLKNQKSKKGKSIREKENVEVNIKNPGKTAIYQKEKRDSSMLRVSRGSPPEANKCNLSSRIIPPSASPEDDCEHPESSVRWPMSSEPDIPGMVSSIMPPEGTPLDERQELFPPTFKGPRTPEGPAPSTPDDELPFTPPSPRSPTSESPHLPSSPGNNFEAGIIESPERVSKLRGPCTPPSEPPVSPPPPLSGQDLGENDKAQESSSRIKEVLEDPDPSTAASQVLSSSQEKPAPVKRKLSILEYRKRKSVNSETDGRGTNFPSLGSHIGDTSHCLSSTNVTAAPSTVEESPGSPLSDHSKGHLSDAESPSSPVAASSPDLPLSPIQPMSLMLMPDVLDKSTITKDRNKEVREDSPDTCLSNTSINSGSTVGLENCGAASGNKNDSMKPSNSSDLMEILSIKDCDSNQARNEKTSVKADNARSSIRTSNYKGVRKTPSRINNISVKTKNVKGGTSMPTVSTSGSENTSGLATSTVPSSSSDVKWNAAPTLLERQRENLTERLRREFGLCVSDDDDEDDDDEKSDEDHDKVHKRGKDKNLPPPPPPPTAPPKNSIFHGREVTVQKAACSSKIGAISSRSSVSLSGSLGLKIIPPQSNCQRLPAAMQQTPALSATNIAGSSFTGVGIVPSPMPVPPPLLPPPSGISGSTNPNVGGLPLSLSMTASGSGLPSSSSSSVIAEAFSGQLSLSPLTVPCPVTNTKGNASTVSRVIAVRPSVPLVHSVGETSTHQHLPVSNSGQCNQHTLAATPVPPHPPSPNSSYPSGHYSRNLYAGSSSGVVTQAMQIYSPVPPPLPPHPPIPHPASAEGVVPSLRPGPVSPGVPTSRTQQQQPLQNPPHVGVAPNMGYGNNGYQGGLDCSSSGSRGS